MRYGSSSGHETRIIVGILVTVALAFLTGFLGWDIWHTGAAVVVPFLVCMIGGPILIAWLDIYGWRGWDSFLYRYRPGWFDRHPWRWSDQRQASRLMKSLYDDRDNRA